MESNSNNEISNIITLKPPRGCNYVDLKDYLVFARKDNDNFVYEINKIKNPDSECEEAWIKLENKSLLRRQIISNCIEETKNEINTMVYNDIDKRKLSNKLNILNMELEVEDIIRDQAKKVFHKICK